MYDRINYLRRIRRNKQIEFDGELSHRTSGDVTTSDLPSRIPEDIEIQYNNFDFNNIPLCLLIDNIPEEWDQLDYFRQFGSVRKYSIA